MRGISRLRPRLVVFDMAGTTVHDGGDAVLQCFKQAMARHKYYPSFEEINKVMGLPKPLAISSITGQGPDVVERIHNDFVDICKSHYSSGDIKEVEGASGIFAALEREGVEVALDTGFSRPICDVILKNLGWTKLRSMCSDEVKRGRPHEDMIRALMGQVGLNDSALVAKVGDTPADLLEGQNAKTGWNIGIISGSHRREQLLPFNHTHLIQRLRELETLWGIDSKDFFMGSQFSLSVRDPLLFTPGPLTTSRTVRSAMMTDVGSRDPAFVKIVADVRNELLDVLCVSKEKGWECVLMQGSGTFAVESAISSSPIKKALVVSNGVYGARLATIMETHKIPHIVHKHTSLDSGLSEEEVRKLVADDTSISHVFMVHLETSTGVVNPIERVGAAVKQARPSVKFCVDAMSSFAAMPIDVEQAQIDMVVASSNKGLEGTPGIGFVICKKEALLACKGKSRTLSLDLHSQWEGLELNGQFRFTPPTQVLLALHQSIVELKAEGGVAARAARYRANNKILREGLQELNVQPLVVSDKVEQSHVISSFKIPKGLNFAKFYQSLAEKGCLIYPGALIPDTFRIGNIGRLSPQDMKNLVSNIKEELRKNH